MARVTERIRLGPAALNPFTLHPYEIAGQIAMLDSVSGGRAYLGLAKGAWLDRLGIEEPRPLAALREAVAIIRALLAGDDGRGRRRALHARARDEARVSASARPRAAPDRDVGSMRPHAGQARSRTRSRSAEARTPSSSRWFATGSRTRSVRLVVGCVTVVDEDGRLGARTRSRGRPAVPRRRRTPRPDARAGRRARGSSASASPARRTRSRSASSSSGMPEPTASSSARRRAARRSPASS